MNFFKRDSPPNRFLRACSTITSVANRLQEPASEFGNAIRLPPPDGLSRNQLSANAQCDRASSDEAECGPLIHASRGDHGDVGKHRFEILDVTVSSDVSAGYDLDKIRT